MGALRVDNDVRSPWRARQQVRTALAGWPPDLIDSACLATSELVTNALMHGGGVVGADLDLHDDLVRVSVIDRNATTPQPQSPDLLAPGGRGLMLVAAFADRWGVTPLTDGQGAKQVWFEIGR